MNRNSSHKEVSKKMKLKESLNRAVGKFMAAIIMLSFFMSLNAKDKKGVIMTVDGEDVPTDEFLYLYQKNNEQLALPQSLDEYLQLFEIYRLKVAEAKAEGVDTTLNFKKEMAQYRRELLEPFITDSAFINHLIDIAVEREKTEVESSHIMIIRTHDQQKDKRNLEILDSLRNVLLNGGDFIQIAKQYSQDKFSSDRGGYLGFNPAGTFPYSFETAVYDTPEGEISEIVESHVGWHIVKSGARKPAIELNHPLRSYDEIKTDVLRKSSSPFDSRFKEIRSNNLKGLKKKHLSLYEKIDSLPEEEIYEVLAVAEEESQYKNNPEYRNIVDEYVNGSLLYEVSVANIWDKAANDEEGLQNFYNLNKDKYVWDTTHAKGILVQAINDSIGELVKEQISDLPSDSIVIYIRQNFKKEAIADNFNMPKGGNPMIDYLMFGEKELLPKNKNFKTYFVVEGRLIDSPEGLSDVRSAVISDYQEELEKDWVNSLKKKHDVLVNQKELARIRKNFNH